MSTNNDQVVDFRSQFQKRLDLGNEAAIASLIYALVYVHQDAARTDSPDSHAAPLLGDKSKSVDRDTTLPPPPFILKLVYHPVWGEYVYANPILLKKVVERVSKRKLVNPDALAVWRGIADLCKAMHDFKHDKEHDKKNKEDALNCLKKALEAYIETLKSGKIPQTGEEQKTMDAVVDFHKILLELLDSSDPEHVPNIGDKESYKSAADKLPGFAIALNWIAGVLDEKEGAVALLRHLLDGKSDGAPTKVNELTSSPIGRKSAPCKLERTLLKTFVLEIWDQES